jgi:nitroimidazol reductase NimA-like FMN-containing flavoprotein (pyridoxamine 5'-phosphate oxidase superfamily)
MLGNLSDNEIEEVIYDQVIGRIGCHADNITYIVPVSYAYDGKYAYVHSKAGKKVDIMRKNPNVCFEVELYEDMANWRTVIAWGRFEEITDETERRAALSLLTHRWMPEVKSELVESLRETAREADFNTEGILYRIEILEKTGRYEEGPEIDVNR